MKTLIAWRSLSAMLLTLALISAASASTALAKTNYLFDPQLSLTGGCATDEVDSVLDPSCPYQAFPGGPSEPFVNPTGMALDSYGNIYVGVAGPGGGADKGHIDIFGADSHFIAEFHVVDPGEPSYILEPRTVAVDSKGYLYVYALSSHLPNKLLRYKPSVYDPSKGEIEYETSPVVIAESASDYSALAIDPQNGHLFVDFGVDGVSVPNGSAIQEFGSGEEDNPQLDPDVASGCCFDGPGLAIDAVRGRLYAADAGEITDPRVIKVFELAAPHALIETIDGSSTPEGGFVTPDALGLAVDEATGHIFAYDEEKLNVIYELSEDGQYLASIRHSLSSKQHKEQVAVDNGEHSPHGALAPNGRSLWATAAPGGIGHAFAFKPSQQCPPTVESLSAAHVGIEDAQLRAEIEPCNVETSYRIEYLTAQQFQASGFEGAAVAGEGTIPAGGVPVGVSAGATGLQPATRYVFRLVASNELGTDEAQGNFKTYPAPPPPISCPNEALRSGPSALLPDCRAYELVTPADTNGLAPSGIGGLGPHFTSLTVSPDGDRAFFGFEGGVLPGAEGTGSLGGDPYLATRGPQGWSTVDIGGKGSEFVSVVRGGRSPDQAYSAWFGAAQGQNSTYLRFPDGHSELLGQGALGTDPNAHVTMLSDSGHAVFGSDLKLEEGAGTGGAVYDRTPDGVTHVVSLLPGDVTPAERPNFAGASQDGLGVAFTVGTKLYLRYNDRESFEIGEGLTFEGVAEGGKRVFYLEGGSLYAFDTEAGTIPFATSGDVTVVNVSAGGAAAYLVSPSRLTSVANPLGEKAKAGKENLYLSREGAIEFIGIVTEGDVVGNVLGVRDGLGVWSKRVAIAGAVPADPSRSTGGGGVFLFSSRAPLTGYDNAGQPELFRYDADPAARTLSCISCDPTERSAGAGATLQGMDESFAAFLTSPEDRIENLTADGRRAFFETTEALVASDTDGLRDVYEWEAQGRGSCTEPEGCIFLVSSGRSAQDDYLYGVSEDGNDVFIATNDLLDPQRDPDGTRSIYDARVGGGFASVAGPSECLGDACQPAARPPERPAQLLDGAGNVTKGAKALRCRKGKHAVRAKGRTRCVAAHKRHQRHKPKQAKAMGRTHR
jgi:hypothetical protein